MKTLAEDFFDRWVAECESRSTSLWDNWSNYPEYNNEVFKAENSIVDVIANGLGLHAYDENYSVDVVFYATRDLVPTAPRNEKWFRRIRIAFEHEHTFDANLFQEVSHLMITDCDLRVLVSYPGSESHRKGIMDVLHDLISGSDRSDSFSSSASFLFILGYPGPMAPDIKWQAYVFGSDSWIASF